MKTLNITNINLSLKSEFSLKYSNNFINNSLKENNVAKFNTYISKPISKQEIIYHEDSLLLKPEIGKHISFKDAKGIKEEIRGKAFLKEKLIEENKSIFRKANSYEIEESNVITFGGIDFDEPPCLAAIAKAYVNLKNNYRTLEENITSNDIISTSKTSDSSIPLVVFPPVSKKDRQTAVKEYNKDYKFYPKYIKELVENYFIPKIYSDDTFFMPFNPIVIFTYSLGGRELLMCENALKDILKNEHKLPEKYINICLSAFRGVSVGCAVDIDLIKNLQGFNKMFIYSAQDIGTERPESLNKKLISSVFEEKDFTVKCDNNINGKEIYSIFLGYDIITQTVKDTIYTSGHALPLYVENINKLPQCTKNIISEWLDPDKSGSMEAFTSSLSGDNDF